MDLNYYQVRYPKSQWSRGAAWANLLAQQIPGCPKPYIEDRDIWGHGWHKAHEQDFWSWVYWGFPVNLNPPKYYVTVTYGMRGYFAVLVGLVDDEYGRYYEPVNSGFGSYRTQREAIPEALEWAEAEEVPFKLTGYNEKGEPYS